VSAASERARAWETRPPLPLAVIHLLLFGGAAFAGIELSFPEWRQLHAVLTGPYAMGELPRAIPLLGAVGCAVLGGWLLARVVRRHTAPMSLSVAILAFAGLTLWPAAPPRFRSWGAADKEILLTAQKVQRAMVDVLETKGEVPLEPGPWREALAKAATAPVPATEGFRQLGYRLEPRPWDSPLPSGLAPGVVVARISPDGAAFTLNPVGFNPSGQAAYLRDERGELLTLRGLFNPNRAPEQVPVPNGALPTDGF
jgi:hypothetical protein